ncbi:ribosomal L18 C-terminal region-domain-containing protein [Phakopsora pachyrhizi]|nr:ribosomal L18 C-terminal region-domain-containing protein [Phakopsora pachyrhizi]
MNAFQNVAGRIKHGLTNWTAAYAAGLLVARRALLKLGLADKYEGVEEREGDLVLTKANEEGYGPEAKELDSKVLKNYIYGGHVAEYMESLEEEEEEEQFKKQFSTYLADDIGSDDIEEIYTKAHKAILANPSPKLIIQFALRIKHLSHQSLWTLTTLKLVSLIKLTAWLSGKYLQSLFAHNSHFLTETNSISPTNDQELFIDYNQRPFSEPQDFQFEPCPIWHNSKDFSLNATEPKILLQNQLGQACLKAKELEPTIDTKRKEVSKLESLTKVYSLNESLGDLDSVLENFLDTVEQTMTLELQYTVLAKEIKVLETTLGDNQGSQRPHNFKLARFVTPTSCYLCNSSIWGITKQGVTCKACSIHAHAKCGLKVPPGSAPMHSNNTHLSSAMAQHLPHQTHSSLSSPKRVATKANNVPPRQANLNRAAASVNSNRAIQ